MLPKNVYEINAIYKESSVSFYKKIRLPYVSYTSQDFSNHHSIYSMENNVLEQAKLHSQQHLVEHYESLIDVKVKENFLQQLNGIDLQQTNQLFTHVFLESKLKKADQKF